MREFKMIIQVIGLSLLVMGNFLASAQETDIKKLAHISFIHPISSDGTQSAVISYQQSLSILTGVTKNVQGTQIAGLGAINKQNVVGLQISGLYNFNKNQINGLQLGGLFGYNGGLIEGSQINGLVSTTRKLSGVQVAGLINHVQQDTFNKGTQVAGLLNVVTQNLKGTQVSGLVNVAKTCKNQIGIINISDSATLQFGVINFNKRGMMQAGLEIDEQGTTLVSLKTGAKSMYSIIGFGFNTYEDKSAFGSRFGFGSKHGIGKKSFVVTEAVATLFSNNKLKKVHLNLTSSFRVLYELNINDRLSFTAGPTINWAIQDQKINTCIPSYNIWKEQNQGEKYKQYTWVGATVGLYYKIFKP